MLARVRKLHPSTEDVSAEPGRVDVPLIAPRADDVESELACCSALLGVVSGNLAKLQRQVDAMTETVKGYTLHEDDSVSLRFTRPTELVDFLGASIALREATVLVADVAPLLVPPESTR